MSFTIYYTNRLVMTHKEFSRRGGKAKSERKAMACRENWKKAVEARRKKQEAEQ